jgi:hypothetical protein
MIRAGLPLVFGFLLWLRSGCPISNTKTGEIFTAETLLLGWIVLAAMYGWVCRARSGQICRWALMGSLTSHRVLSWIVLIAGRAARRTIGMLPFLQRRARLAPIVP